MNMKTVMKKMRGKTEEEKKEKLMNMSKIKNLMKTRARGYFDYNRNDDEYQNNIPMSMKTVMKKRGKTEEEKNEKVMNMSKMKTRA